MFWPLTDTVNGELVLPFVTARELEERVIAKSGGMVGVASACEAGAPPPQPEKEEEISNTKFAEKKRRVTSDEEKTSGRWNWVWEGLRFLGGKRAGRAIKL